MGVYLSKPKTDKKSEDGGDEKQMHYGVSSMQGWRRNMEDAHLVETSLKSADVSLFGVFDGHGGPAVSAWIGREFAPEFEKNLTIIREKFKNNEISKEMEVPCILEKAIAEPPRDISGRRRGGRVGESGSGSEDEDEDIGSDENVIEDEHEEKLSPRSLEDEVVLVCEALQKTFMSLDDKMRKPESRAELEKIHDELKSAESENDDGPGAWAGMLQSIIGGGGKNVHMMSTPDDDDDDDEDDEEEGDRRRVPGGAGKVGIFVTEDVDDEEVSRHHSRGADVDMSSRIEEIHDDDDDNKADAAKTTRVTIDEEEEAGAATEETSATGASTPTNAKEKENDKTDVPSSTEPKLAPSVSENASSTAESAPTKQETSVGSATEAKKGGKAPVKATAEATKIPTDEEQINSASSKGAADGEVDAAATATTEDEVEDPSAADEEVEEEDASGRPAGATSELRALLPHTPEHCGATAVVTAVIRGDHPMLVAANAGDSRVVLSRRGVAIPLSKDHKPNLMRETKRIEAAGGKVRMGRVDGNLNLSRCIGDLAYKSDSTIPPEAQKITSFPDVRVIPLHAEDEFAVIACDGIWDCMGNQEIVDYIRVRLGSKGAISEICEEICDRCLASNPLASEGIGCDNMTLMIVAFGGDLKEKAATATSGIQELPRVYSGRLYAKTAVAAA